MGHPGIKHHTEHIGHHERSSSSIFRGDRGRIAIFIDGSSLFYAALQLGMEIDYHRLIATLTTNGRLLRAFFYTCVDSSNSKQQGFLLWMRRNGYRVVAKELIQMPDGSKKANLDVEIAVDMLALTNHYDTAVLVSGNGCLSYAVDAVSYQGSRIELVSLRSMTSDHLINVADTYIDLETIQHTISKDNLSIEEKGGKTANYTHRPLSVAI